MIKYKSNMDAVLGRLKTMLSENKLDSLYRECALGVFASNERRVHNEGKAVNGSAIGKYSRKAIYVNPARSPRAFSPVGKTGRTTFKSTGKPHKTKYFASGYAGFKSNIGFGSRPNLQATGRLRADWTILRTSKGYQIGWASSYGAKISEGNEIHFGKKIWGISEEDKRNINSIVKRYVKTNA